MFFLLFCFPSSRHLTATVDVDDNDSHETASVAVYQLVLGISKILPLRILKRPSNSVRHRDKTAVLPLFVVCFVSPSLNSLATPYYRVPTDWLFHLLCVKLASDSPQHPLINEYSYHITMRAWYEDVPATKKRRQINRVHRETGNKNFHPDRNSCRKNRDEIKIKRRRRRKTEK